MSKVVACALIIKDDFNNVLILQKKVKRGQEERWSLLTQTIKARETEEKCINRAMKDAFKSIIFNVEQFNAYKLEDENCVQVYLGDLKERFILDKTYKQAKWISKRQLENYNMEELDKKILEDFYR